MRDVLLTAILIAKCNGKSVKFDSIEVRSTNSFPTGCGIASSASGMSAYAYALCKLLDLDIEKFSSILARRGSGSACRSLLGGFVLWNAEKYFPNSCVEQIFNEDHWPELRVILCIVESKTKKNASTRGMQDSLRTSEFMQRSRIEIAKFNLEKIKNSIRRRNFDSLAETIMKESNQLHSICLDTYPPISYLNESSWTIISLVHEINEHFGHPILAYTFDAGPNAFLITLDKDVNFVVQCLSKVFPQEFINRPENFSPHDAFLDKLSVRLNASLQRVHVTRLGCGTFTVKCNQM